jgi:hypothetical protein
MRIIKNYRSFINESEENYDYSGVNVPKEVIFFLKNIVGGTHILKFLKSTSFKEIFLGEEDSNGEKTILLNWKDIIFEIPFVRYDPFSGGKFIGTEKDGSIAIESVNFLKDNFNIDVRGFYNRADEIYDRQKKDLIYQMILELVRSSRKDGDFANIFDLDFENLFEFKALQKLGAKIKSSNLQRKRGVLVLEIPKYGKDVGIYPNGYIRSLGEHPSPVTKDPKLNVPIYNLETLREKLAYLLALILKNELKKYNLPSSEISTVIKQIGGKDEEQYSQIAQEMVNRYPELVLILPEPKEGFNPDVKAGASMLNRFGAFGS